MAEIIQKDGTWVFDGDALRLTPGRAKNVSLLRKELGELAVPLHALAGVSFEQGRKSGRLRLRLRDGADPLLQATGGKLADPNDPYQLNVESDRYGVAEYFVDEVRGGLLLDEVPSGAMHRYLLPGPAVPLSVSAGDGTATFDGEHIRLEWNWKTEDAKAAAGPRSLAVADIAAVEWHPAVGLENGYLRFGVRHAPTKAPPKYDPHSVELRGYKKDPLMALVAAAVQARLPHPGTPVTDVPPQRRKTEISGRTSDNAPHAEHDHNHNHEHEHEHEPDHDAQLRRLRELGELRQAGILTDDEFALAKQAVLKRM